MGKTDFFCFIMIRNLIENLKRTNKWESTLLLGLMTITCIFISLFRIVYTGSSAFFFLNWNIFLAFIPWVLSTCMVIFNFPVRQFKTIVFSVVWLLFFPNTAYILTDLFHLYDGVAMPYWYDFMMLLFYAFTGLLYCIVSLMDIEFILKRLMKYKYRIATVAFLCFLAAFGVYLGRFLRWNSWDAVSNPGVLLHDIWDRIIHPWNHEKTWTFTIMFGLLLNFLYFGISNLRLGKAR